jgi:hypothetical protein
MRVLHTFIQLAPTLETAANTPVKVKTTSRTFLLSDSKMLLYPIADAAVLMSRGLLHFMGIGLQSGNVGTATHQKDDVRMSDVGLTSVAPSDAIANWAMSTARAKSLLKLCIVTGHKVSGHLTAHSARSVQASIAELAQAFHLVNDLVNREVYVALSKPRVEFEATNVYGHII